MGVQEKVIYQKRLWTVQFADGGSCSANSSPTRCPCGYSTSEQQQNKS